MKAVRAGVLALGLLCGVASAQTPPPNLPALPNPPILPGAPTTPMTTSNSPFSVQVLIPSLILLRGASTPAQIVLAPQDFPPAKTPARFTTGSQIFEVSSSREGAWSVQLELRDLLDARGGKLIAARQLYYRVKDATSPDWSGWPSGGAGLQVVLSRRGPTRGWEAFQVQFALELGGGEVGGEYASSVVFTALALP